MTERIKELNHLLARIRDSAGDDRDLDLSIINDLCPHLRTPLLFRGQVFTAYPAGLGACAALVEELLPGWCWKVGTCCVSDDAWVAPDWNSPVHGARLRAQYGEPQFGTLWDQGIDIDRRPPGNVCLALLEALVLALIAEEETETKRGE